MAFAAIREVVEELGGRPDTDWSRVDPEALRRHLNDMRRFTLEADIAGREQVSGGLRVTVRPANSEADASVRRAVRAHTPMLRGETGWMVSVEDGSEGVVIEVAGAYETKAERLRRVEP